MPTFRPSGISIKIREDLVEGSSRSQTTLIVDPIITLDGHRVTMSDIGDICFAKLDQGTSNEEIISFTGITDNTTTYTLTGCAWGYNFHDTTSGVSANTKRHISGSSFIITNDDHYLATQYVNTDADQTVAGVKTFSSTPKSTAGDPLTSTDLVIKSYVDALVLGTLTTINVIVPGKAGETVSIGQLVYFDDTDNEWKLCDADTSTTVNNVLLGIAQGSGTNGNAIANGVLLQGVDDNQSGLTEGDVYYASNTAGAISNSVGTNEVTVGIGKSATELYFNPRFNQQLTEDQQDALAGTSGTPSDTNRYVTNDDTATAGANKVLRLDGSGNLPTVSGENLTNLVITNGRIRTSYIAGENITAGNSVVVQNTGGVINTSVTANSGNPMVLNLTTTADNCWLVGVAGSSTLETFSSLTNATQRGTTAATFGAFFDSNAAKTPAGAYSMSVALTGSGCLGSAVAIKPLSGSSIAYINVSQIVNTAASISVSHTTSGSNRLAIIALFDRGNGTQTVTYGGVSATSIAGNGYTRLFYIMNPPTASTNVIATRSNNSSTFAMWVATYTGVDALLPLLYRTNSTNNDYLANQFLGIAAETKTAGQSCLVDLIVSNQFTFLQPGATYYLSNTSGEIATSAGSQSRKIGLAISQTELLIKYDNP